MEVKGIIHCHSTYSYDAKLSLREIKELCLKNGVRFACMTEHTDELTPERAEAFIRECEALTDETFCFVPGFEVPFKKTHILIIGMRTFLGNYAETIDVLRAWTEQASLVVLAHPVRNNFLVSTLLLDEIDALEIWNQQYEGKRVPRTRSIALLEILREKKPLLLAMGGVDFHRVEHFGAPFVTLSLDTLREASILEKLTTGAFIVSSSEATFYGTIPDSHEVKMKHRFESFVSVSVIVFGKWVNKILATLGLSLPKSLKEKVRRRL